MAERETRSFASRIELREGGGNRRKLVGVAPPWDTLSQDLGGFVEKFEQGAFGDLSGLDVISTFQHDGRLLLGRTPATMKLEDTAEGVRYEVDLPRTGFARDLVEWVERGDVRGSSFEFMVRDMRFEKLEDGTLVRVVTEAELFQVGPVTNPAYQEGTDVALRALEVWKLGEDETQDAHSRLWLRQRLLELECL